MNQLWKQTEPAVFDALAAAVDGAVVRTAVVKTASRVSCCSAVVVFVGRPLVLTMATACRMVSCASTTDCRVGQLSNQL